MNGASHIILLLWLVLAAIFAARMIEAMSPQFMRWYRRVSHPEAKSLAGFAGLVALAAFVVSKDFQGGPSSPDALNGGVLESAEMQSGSSSPALTEAQCRAGLALVAATNVLWDFAAPTNAVFCDLGSGVHDEAYWIPVSFNPEGTATNSRWGRAVCAAPSGMVLLDDVPDRLTPSLPDFSGAATNRVLSVLQTPSGLLPPLGKLWHAPTTNDSFLITWNHVFLGRDTNAVADLQLELFESGDFIYRLRLDENADASAVTNWLIAAQDNGAGEVFAFAENIPLPQLESDHFSLVAATNLIPSGLELSPQTLELRWTSFGELDPDVPDNDNDGLSDWDELYIHHTDPGNADSDADGLWDGEEVNAYGTSPVHADTDGDGDLDFWQFFAPSAFTNAPSAEYSEGEMFFSIATHLEDGSSPADFAVLRIGDAMIPVLPNDWLLSTVSVPVESSTPFTLIPGPGLCATATAALTVSGYSWAADVFPLIDDPSEIFDTSAVYSVVPEEQQRSPMPLAAGEHVPKAPSGQTGTIIGLRYQVTPEFLCPHTGRDTVSIRALDRVPAGTSFLLDFNGSIKASHQIRQSDIEDPPSAIPGMHAGSISFLPVLTGREVRGNGSKDIPAHYCVPFPPEGYYSECDPEGTNYNPYAVPAPASPGGGQYGVVSRPHTTLIVDGGDDEVFVDLDGPDPCANRCSICGCAYGPASSHTPDETASIYRRTDNLEVTPQTLSADGCFSVSGVEPSGDYGGDVFTYRIGTWYNRGRYTVLGLANHLIDDAGPVEEAHVAVGVTNVLFFWTGVRLPTGTLNLSLVGEGPADLLVYNRATHAWERLLSPGVTNHVSTISAWRNTYCAPGTLRVQACLVPKGNGLCTLTQAFEGSGNDLYVFHSVSQTFRVHAFVAEPITSETDASGHVYNPSGIPVGGTAKFKVSLDPMTGFSEDDIVWEAAEVSFVNGDNAGSEVAVVGGTAGGFLLAVQVNGLRLVPVPLFFEAT